MDDGRELHRAAGPPGHPDDELVDLVLGDIDAGRRSALVTHVLRCPACRRTYDELAATVGDLLPGVPGAQPPLGFDERVLARLAVDVPGQGRSTGAGSSPPWRWVATAAAVLVALLVPVGAWLATRGDGSTAGELATLRLSRDDSPVGTVSISAVAGQPVMVVAILEAPAGVSYFCRARLADGTVVDSEAWPSGVGAWVLPLPDDDVTAVDVLPAGTDRVWSSATFS